MLPTLLGGTQTSQSDQRSTIHNSERQRDIVISSEGAQGVVGGDGSSTALLGSRPTEILVLAGPKTKN